MIATAKRAPNAIRPAVRKKKIQGAAATRGDPASDELHAPVDEYVDGAVVLREAEQIGQPEQREEQIDRKAGK